MRPSTYIVFKLKKKTGQWITSEKPITVLTYHLKELFAHLTSKTVRNIAVFNKTQRFDVAEVARSSRNNVPLVRVHGHGRIQVKKIVDALARQGWVPNQQFLYCHALVGSRLRSGWRRGTPYIDWLWGSRSSSLKGLRINCLEFAGSKFWEPRGVQSRRPYLFVYTLSKTFLG
jgi:hypothetical protein